MFIYESVCNVRFELSCPSACQWVREVNSHWRHLVSGCCNTLHRLCLPLPSPCALHMFYKCIQLPSEWGPHRGGTAVATIERHPSSPLPLAHTSPCPAVLAYKSHRKHSDFSRMIFVPSVLGNAAICGFVRYLKERGDKKEHTYIQIRKRIKQIKQGS